MRTRAQVAGFKYFVGKTFSVYIQQKLLTITLEKEGADCLNCAFHFCKLSVGENCRLYWLVQPSRCSKNNGKMMEKYKYSIYVQNVTVLLSGENLCSNDLITLVCPFSKKQRFWKCSKSIKKKVNK